MLISHDKNRDADMQIINAFYTQKRNKWFQEYMIQEETFLLSYEGLINSPLWGIIL